MIPSPSDSLTTYVTLNILFRDRYHVVNQVGTGGFGSVYRAIDTHNENHAVALKEICLRKLSSQSLKEATDSFLREVGFLSQLSHPNLPRFYEHFSTIDYWYLVMDFIEGETLEHYLSRVPHGCLPLSEVLNIGIRLCTVLEYLHLYQPPIVFRDLKPANIMCTPTGGLYLIDFGIARYFKPGRARDTMALGSPGYAAPEQYGKAQTTPRSDIYSLGAVLHQLLTAKDPSETPFRFRPLRPKGNPDPGSLTTSMVDVLVNKLERLIASMLDIDVNKRPPDITSVKQDLLIISTLWSDVYKSFWRPRQGYTQQQTRR